MRNRRTMLDVLREVRGEPRGTGGEAEAARRPRRPLDLEALLARPWVLPGAAFVLFVLLWGGWALFGGGRAEARTRAGDAAGARVAVRKPRPMHQAPPPRSDLEMAAARAPGAPAPARTGGPAGRTRIVRALRIDSYRAPTKTQRGYAEGMKDYLRSRGFDARLGVRGKELVVYVVIPDAIQGDRVESFVQKLRALGKVRRRTFTKDFSQVRSEVFRARERL